MIRNHARNPATRTPTYAELLADSEVKAPAPLGDDGGCWVRRGRSQPMRNLALAERVIWALVAPAGHAHA